MAGLSADEAKIYDRQIRVWGADAQLRLNNAKLLFAEVRGIFVEILKYVALAGAGEITIAL